MSVQFAVDRHGQRSSTECHLPCDTGTLVTKRSGGYGRSRPITSLRIQLREVTLQGLALTARHVLWEVTSQQSLFKMATLSQDFLPLSADALVMCLLLFMRLILLFLAPRADPSSTEIL